MRKQIENTLMGQIYIVDSESGWLDITALHTHKREPVKGLQEMLGVPKEETVSFGDGENDVELPGDKKVVTIYFFDATTQYFIIVIMLIFILFMFEIRWWIQNSICEKKEKTYEY